MLLITSAALLQHSLTCNLQERSSEDYVQYPRRKSHRSTWPHHTTSPALCSFLTSSQHAICSFDHYWIQSWCLWGTEPQPQAFAPGLQQLLTAHFWSHSTKAVHVSITLHSPTLHFNGHFLNQVTVNILMQVLTVVHHPCPNRAHVKARHMRNYTIGLSWLLMHPLSALNVILIEVCPRQNVKAHINQQQSGSF